MFLAGKVEETPRALKDVILVSYEILHKKDPAASQKIKLKEVYEQQKQILLFGERVVLATLGFDLNVHHPYKPLVKAIKKLKVAQSALAKVAWNFVNDGLRTSLCLQYEPRHLAAGAIFLAARFLKMKLPSNGDKVWWQEFDVTPWQLEDISNQMLELYDQKCTFKASGGSEVDGSTNSMTACCPAANMVAPGGEPMSTRCHSKDVLVANVKRGGPVLSPARSSAEQSATDSLNRLKRVIPNQDNDCGCTEAKSGVWDHYRDEGQDIEPLFCRENTIEASSKSESQMDQPVEDVDISRKSTTMEAGKRKDKDLSHNSTSAGSWD